MSIFWTMFDNSLQYIGGLKIESFIKLQYCILILVISFGYLLGVIKYDHF